MSSFAFVGSVSSAEEGQTSAEYVGISAVAIVIAITVAWFVLKIGLETAIEGIGESIVNFISTAP